MKNIINYLVFVVVVLFCSCSTSTEPKENQTTPPKINSVHTALGVPCDNDSTDDFYIIRHQYVVSYNKNLNVCNWVAYNLNEDWFGDVTNFYDDYITDDSLPLDFYHVHDSDFTNPVWGHGQLIMPEERTLTVEDNKSTFILSTILPMTTDLDMGPWTKYKFYCISFADRYKQDLYIIAGGIYLTKNRVNKILTIPDSVFQIVVMLDKGKGLKDVTKSTKVMAVIMPNINGIRNDGWLKYETTVDRIENSTGYDFLSSVSKNVQAVIEK